MKVPCKLPLCQIFTFATLLCQVSCTNALSSTIKKKTHPSRRVLVKNAIQVAGTGSALLSSLVPKPANAARGAFELDSEYYFRDLFGGNKKEGNIMPSKPPDMPPPRKLRGPLLPFLLDNGFSVSCIPVRVLAQQIDKKQNSNFIADSAKEYRDRAKRSFYTRAPWMQEDVSDQYYFDVSAYALWKAAADCLPKYEDRDVFVRNVGRALYQEARSASLLTENTRKKSIVSSESAIREGLELFLSSNFIKGYQLTTDQSIGERQGVPLFDALDEEALANGASVDCIVSVYEPSTLGASLQITGEQSRFTPEYVGPTLAAIWGSIGFKSTWEVFFVDNEYRPNPKDYFPNEVAIQFSITIE